MNVPARLEYLNKHRQTGDIKALATHFELSISTVSDIVAGRFLGTNGEKVLQKLEEIIDERIKKARILDEIYKKKLEDSH